MPSMEAISPSHSTRACRRPRSDALGLEVADPASMSRVPLRDGCPRLARVLGPVTLNVVPPVVR